MAAERRLTVIAVLILSITDVTSSLYSTIHVSATGSLDKSCGSTLRPCKTLDIAIQKALSQGPSNTRILLREGAYTLSRSYSFTKVKHFTIVGEGVDEGQSQVSCFPNVSIAFVFSSDIGLYNLKFIKCSGWQKSLIGREKSTKKMNHLDYLTALYFSYCKNVQVHNVEVSQSDGVGMTFTDVSGYVNISDSVFKDNRPRRNVSQVAEDSDEANAGGGIFLLLNSYGYNPLNISKDHHETYQHNGRFVLNNVQFIANEARNPDNDNRINSPLTPFSRGGGIGLYLYGNASNNAFTLSRCTFIGNHAQWGGGFQAEFRDNTENNIIEVKESTFTENFASYAGGGARIGDVITSKNTILPNTFTFTDCTFDNNTSIWGGGISIYGTSFMEKSPFIHKNREKVVLINTVFSENRGNVGSALGLFLFNLNPDNIGPLVPVHVVLENCSITNNYVTTTKHDILVGQGTVYTVEMPIISKGYLQISNNSHTSMVLDSAIFVIHGRVDFLNNTGYRGGALAMYGNSKIRYAAKSKVYFTGNQCVEKGGAIYVNAPGSPQVSFNATGYPTHQCFFEYNEESGVDFDLWKTEIIFQGNVGPNEESGLSVYATSLQNCRRAGESRRNNTVLQWKFIKFLTSNGLNFSDVNREVSTDPVDLVFRKKDWNVAPSEIFNASISLLDEIGNPVYGIINIDIQTKESTSHARLATPSSLFLVEEKQVKLIILNGRNGDHFDVVLRSVGRYVLREKINDLTLRDCNHGFHSENDKCVCSDSKFSGISRCAEDGQKVFLKRGYWAGMVDKQFNTVTCPVNYCRCSDPYRENAIGECTYVKNEMCAGDRDPNSVLCGKCKPGYTASFGSKACVLNCSKGNIAYFLVIGLGLTVVVMLLMLIEVDAFTGYLNAWLYSYQVISLLTPGSFEFDGFMKFIIGLANLKISFGDRGKCLTEGLDESDKLAIMYILPGFVLLLVYLIAYLVKRFPNCCYSKKVKAPFSAFSTIFVLCYTNITGISLRILHPVKIGDEYRVFDQGELKPFHGKHIIYGVLACFCIAFIVIPIPVLLMFQPRIERCFRRCNVSLLRFKPLFDKLQGCFKDQYRWCAAFYFLARLIILLMGTLIPQSQLQRALLQATCVAILVVFLWLRPYKENSHPDQTNYSWINASDAILLTNLTLITIFSSVIDEKPSRHGEMKVSVNILAYVPLVVLVFVFYRSFDQYYRRNKRGEQTKLEFIRFKCSKCLETDRNEAEVSLSDSDAGTTAISLNPQGEILKVDLIVE